MAHQIGQHLAVAGAHHRAFGHHDQEVFAARAVALVPGAVLARRRTAVRMVAEGEERCGVAIGNEEDVAPGSTVAAVRPTFGHVRLAPEGHGARAAIAAAQVDLDLVDE